MASLPFRPGEVLLRQLRRGHVLASCSSGQLRAKSSTSLPEASSPPLILLLDLDETLVRSKIQRIHAKRNLAHTDFTFIVDDSIECSVSVRPGVSQFLDWIRARRASGHISGPWIYSMGAQNYVKPLICQMNPERDIFEDRILTKDACTPLPLPWPWMLKSLTEVPCDEDSREDGNANFQRMVLIDNNVMSAILHPENTMLVRDWMGDGKDDRELERVSATLDAVITADAAEGSLGDYQSHLVKATPRFEEFQHCIANLHERMMQEPDPEQPFKRVLLETWKEALGAKRMLLRMEPNEV